MTLGDEVEARAKKIRTNVGEMRGYPEGSFCFVYPFSRGGIMPPYDKLYFEDRERALKVLNSDEWRELQERRRQLAMGPVQ